MRFHEPSQTVLVEVVGRPVPGDPAPELQPVTEPVAHGRGPEPEPAPRS